MSSSDQIKKLGEQIGSRVGQAVRQLRDEVRSRLDEDRQAILDRLDGLAAELPATSVSSADLAPLAESADSEGRARSLADLLAGLAALDRGRSQAEVLNALLAEAGRYASRTALFLTRAEGAQAWGSYGWGESAAALAEVTIEYDGVWERLAAGGSAVTLRGNDCAALCSRIESPLPVDGLLVPLVLRDRVAAALYADRLAEGDPLSMEALQALTYAAALLIETLPFRERAETPTLKRTEEADEGGAGLSLWEAATGAAVGVEEPAAVEAPALGTVAIEDLGELDLEAAATDGWSLDEDAAGVAVAEPEAAEPELVEAELAELDLAEPDLAEPDLAELELTETEIAEPTPAAAEPWGAEPAAEEWEVEPEPDTTETGRDTVLLSPDDLAPALAEDTEATEAADEAAAGALAEPEELAEDAGDETHPGAARREEPPPAVGAAAGSTLVTPPSDIEGPGWAFSPTQAPPAGGHEEARDEARRLARLLVSEIRLYNEEQVEEGRRNRDIYERLRDDIERSRQMYEERVGNHIRAESDYFHDELVRILGAGDAGALGM